MSDHYTNTPNDSPDAPEKESFINRDSPPAKNSNRYFFYGSFFFLSFTVIALQLALIRSLNFLWYYHFSYLIISVALLGFGVSGTFLTFFYSFFAKRFHKRTGVVLFLFLLSIPGTYYTSQQLPIDIQYFLYSTHQVFLVLLYTGLLFIPFFLGALAIGLILTNQSDNAASAYGINLAGSGLGGIGALVIMSSVPPAGLVPVMSLPAFLALMLWLAAGPVKPVYFSIRVWITALLSIFIVIGAFLLPKTEPDQYKMIGYLQELEKQQSARHIASSFDARARIDLFESPVFHHALFASPQAVDIPPAQIALLIDGNLGGSVFNITSLDETRILDHTPQSIAYRLSEQPRVLILGETGGTNILLALRNQASSVTVVQSNPAIVDVLKKTLEPVLKNLPAEQQVNFVTLHPRSYLEQLRAGQEMNIPPNTFNDNTHKAHNKQNKEAPASAFADPEKEKFDIIHLAATEGVPAGSGGLLSLHEDYLLTVEAITTAWGLLSSDGLITATRGLQSPPRDNPRLFALFCKALHQAGIDSPQLHLLQARNYLAATTIMTRSPLDKPKIENFKSLFRPLSLDGEHYPGIISSSLEQRNRLPGPEDRPYSYLHALNRAILFKTLSENGSIESKTGFDSNLNSKNGDNSENDNSENDNSENDNSENESFENESSQSSYAHYYTQWVYALSAPTDDSPYFHNFFTWSGLPSIMNAYGDRWYERLELGYAVLVITALGVVIAAFTLILLPLLTRLRGSGKKWPTLFYFLAIGFGFMFLEMIWIQRLILFLGDPVTAASAVITSLLIWAGLGSYSQGLLSKHIKSSYGKSMQDPQKRIQIAVIIIVPLIAIYTLLLTTFTAPWIGAHAVIRYVIVCILILPPGFLMGWFFPAGLEILNKTEPKLIPFAWGVNGFASVAAAPGALLLTTSMGFTFVGFTAAFLYLLLIPASFFLSQQRNV